jgi:hypothetical protein
MASWYNESPSFDLGVSVVSVFRVKSWGEERIDGRCDSALELFTATILHIVVARAFDVHQACAVAAPLFFIRDRLGVFCPRAKELSELP